MNGDVKLNYHGVVSNYSGLDSIAIYCSTRGPGMRCSSLLSRSLIIQGNFFREASSNLFSTGPSTVKWGPSTVNSGTVTNSSQLPVELLKRSKHCRRWAEDTAWQCYTHGAAMAPGFEAQHHPYAEQSSLYLKNSPNQNNSHFPSMLQTTGFKQEQGTFMNPGSSPYLPTDKLDSG